MSDTPEMNSAPEGAPVSEGQVSAPAADSTWFSAYDEPTQTMIQNKGYADVSQDEAFQSLSRSYQNLESMRGVPADQLFTIKPDMSDDDRGRVWSAMGRPDAPEAYSIEVGDNDMPELTDWFKGAAHEMGLTDKQASNLYQQFNEKTISIAEGIHGQRNQEHLESVQGLQREWGGAYEGKINKASRAADFLGIDETAQAAIRDSGAGVTFLKALDKVASMMSEGEFVGMDPESSRAAMGAMTKHEAQSKLAKLNADPEFMARLHSQDKNTRIQASKERQDYLRIIAG